MWCNVPLCGCVPLFICVDVNGPYRGCVTLSVQRVRLWRSRSPPFHLLQPALPVSCSVDTLTLISEKNVWLVGAFPFPLWGPVSFEWSGSCSYSFSEQLYDKDLCRRLTNGSTTALFRSHAIERKAGGSHIMQTHSRDNTWRVSAHHHLLAVVF